MKLIIITIALLSIFFSAVLSTCSAFPIQLQPSLMHEAAVNAIQQLSLPTLPRKLRFTEKVKEYDEATNLASQHNKKESILPAGNQQYNEKQNMVLGKKGTREEWKEMDEAFTMDYSRVKRRRPIHNKQFPVVP